MEIADDLARIPSGGSQLPWRRPVIDAQWAHMVVNVHSLAVWRELDWQLAWRTGADCWLTVALAGQVGITAGSREWQLSAGQALLIPAGVRHRGRLLPGCSWWASVSLHLDLRDGHGRDLAAALGVRQLDLPTPKRWSELLCDLVASYGLDPAMGARFAGIMIPQLLIECIPVDSWRSPGDPDPELLAAVRLLELDPTASIAALAARCALSPSRFRERFRSAYGRSPVTWRQERQMLRAAAALRAGATVAEAASQSGFCNRNYFSQAFTAAYGCSPARWREGGGP
jgi:AraC-like DNA-binding protein